MPGSATEQVGKDTAGDKKVYAEKEDVFFNDGREIELLHFIYGHPSIAEIRGSPRRVLDAIDEFGVKRYLMNVGSLKGKIVVDLIEKTKPQIMLELGGYVGYSAVLFGDAARRAGGKCYYSLERNPGFAAVVLSLVNLAGLADFVKVVVGPSADSIGRLYAVDELKHIDLMFLDHWKPAYVTDLKLCEKLKLITPGTVLAADNCIEPGNPPYLEYVRSSVQEKREKYKQEHSNEEEVDAFTERFKKSYSKSVYAKSVVAEKLDTATKGNPNLIYESTMVHSFEPSGVPDGIEITECIGEEIG